MPLLRLISLSRSLQTILRINLDDTHFSAKGGQHLLHGPPQTGADPHPAPGQGHGLARDFPFPAVDGKMKLS